MLSEEKVTITIVITGKVTGETTVINVPTSEMPELSPNYDEESIRLEVWEFPIRTYRHLESLSLTFKPIGDKNGALYRVIGPTREA